MSENEDDWREEAQPTIKSEEPLKSSRLIKNDQKWEPLKEKIRRIYMVEDKTLPVTMNKIELEHGFKASVRKWKNKLKDWGFDKNIPAQDMQILVAKAEKRARDDGKETIFSMEGRKLDPRGSRTLKGGRRPNSWKLHHRVLASETPPNITYNTPGPHTEDGEEFENLLNNVITIESIDRAIHDFERRDAPADQSKHHSQRPHFSSELDSTPENAADEEDSHPSVSASLENDMAHYISLDLDLGATKVTIGSPEDEDNFPHAAELATSLAGKSMFAEQASLMNTRLEELSFVASDNLLGPDRGHEESHTLDDPAPPSPQQVSMLASEDMSLNRPSYESLSHKLKFNFSPISREQIRSSRRKVTGIEREDHLVLVSGCIAKQPQGSSLDQVWSSRRAPLELFPGSSLTLRSRTKWLCVVLDDLARIYKTRRAWDEAVFTILLQRYGYESIRIETHATTGYSLEEREIKYLTNICTHKLARIFEKKGDALLAQIHYRKALDGFETGPTIFLNPHAKDYHLKCRLSFADFLLRQEKKDEARHMYLVAILRAYSSKSVGGANKILLIKVFAALKELFIRMEPEDRLVRQLMVLQTLIFGDLNTWSLVGRAFARLANTLSVLGAFNDAELLYKSALPDLVVNSCRTEMLKDYTSYTEHWQRQNMWAQSLHPLEIAFGYLNASIDIDSKIDTTLERLLHTARIRLRTTDSIRIEEQLARIEIYRKTFAHERSQELGRRVIQERKREREQLGPARGPPRRTISKQTFLDANDTSSSTAWTTSTQSSRFGVTYSDCSITGVSNSVYMHP
ncbi:hypothetical protein LHYA1_G005969 [Lachnellula hyalina]|uniref:Clr5 domain-containing protein n=1 Tax=Lachnellula hyalina TaxID=1316788 RepID=A0A8H8QYB7_9HELO|nr:uncharacterized protein LHYA1_G005969 [Lachnellula hyalina]TVY25108.1 hypothetical protein LHYA1_G005969 [Lachnellula hyalina]